MSCAYEEAWGSSHSVTQALLAGCPSDIRACWQLCMQITLTRSYRSVHSYACVCGWRLVCVCVCVCLRHTSLIPPPLIKRRFILVVHLVIVCRLSAEIWKHVEKLMSTFKMQFRFHAASRDCACVWISCLRNFEMAHFLRWEGGLATRTHSLLRSQEVDSCSSVTIFHGENKLVNIWQELTDILTIHQIHNWTRGPINRTLQVLDSSWRWDFILLTPIFSAVELFLFSFAENNWLVCNQLREQDMTDVLNLQNNLLVISYWFYLNALVPCRQDLILHWTKYYTGLHHPTCCSSSILKVMLMKCVLNWSFQLRINMEMTTVHSIYSMCCWND